jgi:hypothetical protein
VASLASVIDDTSQGKVKTNETFIVQASLTIVTYDRKYVYSTGRWHGLTFTGKRQELHLGFDLIKDLV